MTAVLKNTLSAHHARLPVTCEHCNLGRICIPKGLTREEIESLGTLVRRNNTVPKGAALYHAGSPFRGVIAVRSGSAKLVALDRNGNEYIVDFVLPGELLGFDGFSTERYRCTAIALESVNYCELPTQQLEVLARDTPSLAQVLLQRSGYQFDASVEKMVLSRKNADERVASFIIHISERLRLRGYASTELRLSMSREEIGNYLGITHETVSRLLHQFQAQGLINVKSKQLTLIDRAGLYRYCSED